MTPFLRQVAASWLERGRRELKDYCFVFPNKRSGAFFRHHLMELSKGQPLIMPAIMTVREIMAPFTSLAEAPALDRLFTLYNAYRQVASERDPEAEIADFDRFMRWGETVLSDFNDVDLSLVDPARLFRNVENYKEISSNFLTPEQRDILSQYWGKEFHVPADDDEVFWNHLHRHDEATLAEGRFLKLWELLEPLYHRFGELLAMRSLASPGMIVRDALRVLDGIADSSQLPFSKYIFTGFNVLTVAELKLCTILQRLGAAEFCWDVASPVMATEGSEAARFMRRNVKMFGNSIVADQQPGFPEIHVTGVPSAVGQTKASGRQLRDWVEQGLIPDPADAIDTALVLPDENLLVPMTHALPAEISSVNVTMGFPMKATSFASFLSDIASLQKRAQKVRDAWGFFYEDVRALISHPLLRRVAPEGCSVLEEMITSRRLFMVPEATVAAEVPELAFVFTAVTSAGNGAETHRYYTGLLTRLLELSEGEDESDIETFFIRSALETLGLLGDAVARCGVDMSGITFIDLYSKSLLNSTVNFRGEPLRGLQMMGVLETRALDFDNIIMLSMNEGVFPRSQVSRSFIPESLRRCYGMSTAEFQESIFAYSFFRLISRASRVHIYYDSRAEGGRTGEMSRYIAQLLYLFPQASVTHDSLSYDVSPAFEQPLAIRKDARVMDMLRSFTPAAPDDKKRYLSASSINTYINCPLSFYLKYLRGLDLDEETIGYMDSATYGSILHEIAETVYNDMRRPGEEYVRVTAPMLEGIIRDIPYMSRVITTSIRRIYLKQENPDGTIPLTGEAKVMHDILMHFLKQLLRSEQKLCTPYIDFIAAEMKVVDTMKISDSLSVNIKQYIDRVDRVTAPDGTQLLRIVDYKTGSDTTEVASIDQLFHKRSASSPRAKAVLQLMFYCNAYAAKTGHRGAIQPLIYKMRTLGTDGVRPLMFEKQPLMDYRTINDSFREEFAKVVGEIFDPETPFGQTPDPSNCHFCSFKPLCRRG